mmetsp:Transcript_9530/g.17950  ORF Transcript_9530/g.17950 Transcript_9530/m.17950 type:complete len:202 (-) Transcript_9530:624-1229(-)
MQFLKLMNVPEHSAIAAGRLATRIDAPSSATACAQTLLALHPQSPFLLSHQAALWSRSLMVSLMRDGESAFENEVLGTQRLQRKMAGIEIRAQSQNPAQAPFNAHAVRFDWYRAVMGTPGVAGKMNAYGQLLQQVYQLETKSDTNKPKLLSQTTAELVESEVGWLPAEKLIPQAAQVNLNKIDGLYGLLDGAIRQNAKVCA